MLLVIITVEGFLPLKLEATAAGSVSNAAARKARRIPSTNPRASAVDREVIPPIRI